MKLQINLPSQSPRTPVYHTPSGFLALKKNQNPCQKLMRLPILVISYLIFSAADAYPLLGFLKRKTPATAAPAKPQLSRQNAGISKSNQQNADPPTSQLQPNHGASTSNANAPKRTTLQDLLNQGKPAAATPPTPRPNATPNKPSDSSKGKYAAVFQDTFYKYFAS